MGWQMPLSPARKGPAPHRDCAMNLARETGPFKGRQGRAAAILRTALLIRLRAGLRDHVAPFDDFAADESAEFFRRHRRGLDTDRNQAFLDARIVKCGDDRLVELCDDLRRRARSRNDAEPAD